MTAPAAPSVTRTVFGSGTTDHYASLPSMSAGRLAVAVIETTSETPATPSGWSTLGTSTSNTLVRLTMFARETDGAESSTVNFATTNPSTMIVHILYYSEAGYTIADCLVAGTEATGTSSAPNPPSNTSGWGSADVLWTAIGAAYTAGGSISAAPSGYSDFNHDEAGLASLATAHKSATASSDNPGTFTVTGTAYYWVAQTLAVRLNPSPPAPDPPTISDVSPATFAFGEAGIVITGADFEASKGAGKVELSDNATYASGTKVTQSTSAWSATEITFTAVQGSFSAGTFYVWVTNNTGDRNSTGYSVTLTEDTPPPPPTAPGAGVLSGALQVQIYGSPPVGMIDDILVGARIEEGVLKLPSATFSAPLNATGVDLAVDGAEIGIRRVGVGEIFRGFIQKRTEISDDTGATIVHFQCADLGMELANRQTWRSLLALDESVASAQTTILSGSGWTPKLTGSGYLNVTREWINTSLLNAWADLALAANAYWRRTATSREIEIINTNPSTGLVLTNSDEADLTSARFGVIKSIDRVEYDYGAIVNRVGCEIKTDSARLVTLQESTRSSPYTITSAVRRPARIVSARAEIISTAGAYVTNVPMLGENRYGIGMAIATVTTSSVATLGGQFLGQLETASGSVAGLWGGISPSKGNPQAEFKVTFASISAGAVIAVENVDQVNPVIESDTAAGSSTTPAITVDSETDSIVICIVIQRTGGSNSITPTSGEVLVAELGTEGGLFGVFDKDQVTVWSKPGGASTTSFSFSIPSQQWEVFAISLRAAATHYIQDSTSISAYGVREQNLALGSYGQIEEDNENVANTAYDYLVDYLTKRKDPPVSYGVSVSYLPSSPLDWLPGDSMDLKYRDANRTIDEELIVVNRTQTFGEGGSVEWGLELSDRAMFRRDERGEWLLAQLMAGISSAQANQV